MEPNPPEASAHKQSVQGRASGLAHSMTASSNIWDEFTMVEPLGSGTFGVVNSVSCRTSRQRFAAKTVRLNEQSDPELLMASLTHPNILELYRVLENGGERHLILGLCTGGDLEHWCLGSRGAIG